MVRGIRWVNNELKEILCEFDPVTAQFCGWFLQQLECALNRADEKKSEFPHVITQFVMTVLMFTKHV